MWCQWITSYTGKCGMWIESGERCKRHKGLKEKPKKEKGMRFRGNSKWGKEIGVFKSNSLDK